MSNEKPTLSDIVLNADTLSDDGIYSYYYNEEDEKPKGWITGKEAKLWKIAAAEAKERRKKWLIELFWGTEKPKEN